MREDGFFNTIIGHGMKAFDPTRSYKYGGLGEELSDQELDDLYTYNGIVNKIIRTPANEAVRPGIKLLDSEKAELEQMEEVQSLLEDMNVFPELAKALAWDRLFGGAAVLIIADDGRKLDEPINYGTLRKIVKLEAYEPPEIEVHEDYINQDPSSLDYGKPEYYTLIGYHGNSFLVHCSRLLIMRGSTISKRIRRSRNGWGGRVLDRVRENVLQYDVGLSLALLMLSRLSQSVMKLDGLSTLLQTDEGNAAVQKRLQLIDMARHLMNTIALDKDDEYDIKNITVTGVEAILQQFQLAICAVTSIPATVLWGRSPAGENATGQADQENYYSMVQRIQQNTLKPCLVQLLDIIAHCQEYGLHLPDKYTIEFNPLQIPDENEKATVESVKAQTAEHLAGAARTLHDLGALDASEVRNKLKQGDTFDIDDSLDDDLSTGEGNANYNNEYPEISDGDRTGVQQNTGKPHTQGNGGGATIPS